MRNVCRELRLYNSYIRYLLTQLETKFHCMIILISNFRQGCWNESESAVCGGAMRTGRAVVRVVGVQWVLGCVWVCEGYGLVGGRGW